MWEFFLRFELPEGGKDPKSWLDALFEAGCNDATVGIGTHGVIALDFTRAASTVEEAVRSAIENVRSAIPGAQLLEIRPELTQL